MAVRSWMIAFVVFTGIFEQLVALQAESNFTELPETVYGTYVNDPSRERNFAELSSLFPLPDSVSWQSNTRMWIGKLEDEYAVRYVVDSVYSFGFLFKLNEKGNITFRSVPVEYVYKITDHDATSNTTTLVAEFVTERGSFTVTCVFDGKSLTKTYRSAGREAFRYYKRILPIFVDGTYEPVPELVAPEEEANEFCHHVDDIAKIQFYRDGNNTHYNRVTLQSGTSTVYPFHLDGRTENASSGNLSITYKYEYPHGPRTVLYQTTNVVGTDKNISSVATFNQTGVVVVYKSGGTEIKRFYRRMLPSTVLAKFKSTPSTDQFTAFAKDIKLANLAEDITVEIAETPDHTYVQRNFKGGDNSSIDFPFVLGQKMTQSVEGRDVEYTHLFLEDVHPVLRTVWEGLQDGPRKLDIVGTFTPDGYKATYISGDRVASRNYTRISRDEA
ncbi:hypothetical protein RvY_05846 [Ramazzottius varieornatus]|uniref:Glycosyl hydrolase family 38 C-terminal domain-containing protein n=1 Tax=Ramazzottius varieornatus TaxID=947166 RepID=A0A1D1V330_RAMVA|nr:hypothetical protein RvY_05846 [Ramazzottius varieornatus]